jgi:hypothetical protein
MRMLMGGTRKHVDDTQTFIMVGVNRLQEEYDLGRADQLKDEHDRKFTRIIVCLGVTGLSITASFFEIDSALAYGLLVNGIVTFLL